MNKLIISPSLLGADFTKLNEEVKKVESVCSWLHLDVMDGVFVPNISFGIPVIKSLRKETKLFFDTHLMITKPIKYIKDFVNAGADLITFHLEACLDNEEVVNTITKIKENNVKVGISLKPNTSVETIFDLLINHNIDLVLIMSVEPGFGGQEFIPSSLDKIKKLKKFILDNNLKTLIEVDGGINDKTAKEVINAGVDVLVSGSYLFKSNDFKKAVESLC